MTPELDAKVKYFTHRETITMEGWLEAASLGDAELADKIISTGLTAEHTAADPSFPPELDFPLSVPADLLADLRDKESIADAALAELQNNIAAGKYGSSSVAQIPRFEGVSHDKG